MNIIKLIENYMFVYRKLHIINVIIFFKSPHIYGEQKFVQEIDMYIHFYKVIIIYVIFIHKKINQNIYKTFTI